MREEKLELERLRQADRFELEKMHQENEKKKLEMEYISGCI